ncbi:MAG: RtcB family protein [Anaerolineae bacterium]|nr:RtcB family protein [Anaerolineae bacterium]
MGEKIKVDEHITLERVAPYVWEIPKHGDMLVPGRIFGDREMVDHLIGDVKKGKEWNALEQIVNVACLPGIQVASLAMADVHPGYGFPIGGVGGFDTETGIISVAGVGFDINCGVRTLRTSLREADIEPKKEDLADALFRTVPAGLGSTGDLKLSLKEIDQVLVEGARFSVRRGYGFPEDLQYIEDGGCLEGADPAHVSHKAKERQFQQVGTLGSGNHYCEVQIVDEIYAPEVAEAFGLFLGQVLISIHSGSRALGHQIGTDYLPFLEQSSKKYGIPIRERELVCAPFKSPEGQQYFAAMKAGANCAYANRQALAHLVRVAFKKALGTPERQIETLYEVPHNIAKLERHVVDGVERELIVHRKGATRAFGPGRPELPAAYRAVGQPVLVGGTMGTHSYILCGTSRGLKETFGSALHGAGRSLSRNQAKKQFWGGDVIKELGTRGIIIRAHSKAGVAEEAPGAYKDVLQVVDVMHNAGIVRKVARLRPVICVKG